VEVEHTPRRIQSRGRKAAAFALFAVALLAALTLASAARSEIPAPPPPQVWSDKPDYAPGETVTLSGANWAPGESVHIRVNDDAGQTWSRDVDVVADGNGAFTDQFNLPDWFVAVYSVTATGASSGTATWSFTDANVKIRGAFTGGTSPGSDSFTLSYVRYSGSTSGAACTGTPRASDSPPQTQTVTTADFTVPPAGHNSVLATAAATSSGGRVFVNWTDSSQPGNPQVTTSRTWCFAFPPGGTDKTFVANYRANAAPVIAADNATVTASEGQTATNMGTWSDADAGDTVTLSASVGTVTRSGTNASGTWSWSFGTSDGPDDSQTVTITANDGTTTSSTTFSLVVNNAPPVVTLNGPTSANEGETKSYNFTVTDPGNDPISAVSASCGANGTKSNESIAANNASGSFDCTFPNGPASSTVSVSATDTETNPADQLTGSASKTVIVANVAPTVTFSAANDTSVNEGAAEHTYSYSISDPGADTVSAVATSCDPPHGQKVAGSDTNTDTSGSFKCTFADGPDDADLTAAATDSDGATGASAHQSVHVNNVAPTVTFSAANDTSVNEGAAEHTYAFSVSDPGEDGFTVDAYDCGINGNLVAGSLSTSASGGSFECVFPDGPANSSVYVRVSDSDGASGSDSEAVQIVAIANVAPTATFSNDGPVDEGSPATVSFSNQSDPSAGDTAAGFHYAYSCNGSPLGSATYAGSGSSPSHNCTFGDNGDYVVTGRIIDRNDGGTTYETTVHVRNVAPTASNGTFVLDPVLGTATAGFDFSDVGWLDTHGPNLSFFTWSDVGDRFATVTETNAAPAANGHASDTRTFAPGCFNLTVTGTAKDDEGATSAPLAIYSNSSAAVYGRGFRPPIMDNERNIAKYGNVVPVKVVLTNTCTGATVTNVPLYITIAKGVGDEAIEDTNLIAESVSAADSGSQMRTADGMYIYNLSTKSLQANTNYTIRIRPNSTSTPYILQAVLYPKK
jgi:hypothetical protein